MDRLHNLYNLREHRKELRKNSTPQEEKLWWYLRREQFGVKFRRQHGIGGYIVDFFCKEKRLIVEVDGEIHNTKANQEYDSVRDKFITDFGYLILRISNSEVDNDIEAVLKKIKDKL